MNNDEVAGRHGVAELAEQLEEVEIMDEENEDEGKDGDTDKEEGREDQDPYGTYSYNELGANGEVVAVVTVMVRCCGDWRRGSPPSTATLSQLTVST